MSNSGIIFYKKYLKKLARKNRKNPSEPEIKIWSNILRNKLTGYKFLRQKPINNFIVDFYCSKLLLVIEIDGDSHYQNDNYDLSRDKILNNLGLKIIRYNNYQVMNNLEGIYFDVMKQIKIRKKELNIPATTSITTP